MTPPMSAISGKAVVAHCGPNAAFKQCDVGKSEQVGELVTFAVETFGGLHVMMNNAGISGARHPRLLGEDFADFERVMAMNLLGVCSGPRLPHLPATAAATGTSKDLANAVWCFAGDLSSFVTGTVLPVDGEQLQGERSTPDGQIVPLLVPSRPEFLRLPAGGYRVHG